VYLILLLRIKHLGNGLHYRPGLSHDERVRLLCLLNRQIKFIDSYILIGILLIAISIIELFI
jgi:hypothetical protein